MIKPKLLSAGLIAAALFAAPAMAREHQVTSRHLSEGASARIQQLCRIDGISLAKHLGLAERAESRPESRPEK